jgi:hypothetical protein
MFEYKFRYFGFHEMNNSKMIDFLNKEGKDGWELIQIVEKPFIDKPHETANYTFYFKRKLDK